MRAMRLQPIHADAAALLLRGLQPDHRAFEARDPDVAEREARRHIRDLADQLRDERASPAPC
jgi:hypothetical protein